MSRSGQHPSETGYAGWLGERSDAELTALLAVRPDLFTPVPADIGALAARATRPLSLERALDDLDLFSLHVIETLLASPGPVPAAAVGEMLGAPPGPLNRCLAALCGRALLWQADAGFRPAPGLRAVIGEPPGRGAPGHVPPTPPVLGGVPNGLREVDQAAADAALGALRCVADLLNHWAAAPPPVLRSGGLGIRELRKAAQAADVGLPAAALFTEVARAAGLLSASSWSGGEWLPAPAFDTWLDRTHADRWAEIVSAWLATTRMPSLAGSKDEGGRVLNVLATGLDRMDAPRVRARVLGELAGTAPGTAVSTGAMLERIAWLWPRRRRQPQAMLVEATLREAALLGMTGLGALATFGRAAVSAGMAEAAATLAPILPEPVGHVLLQADLTAVAPGPPAPRLARELSLAAEVESRGGATVYRFSAGSLRRAMDAGYTGERLLAMLAERSRTPVPQPLRYLIEDVARRHGSVRVGAASAYIRCDDPAVAAEIAADRRAARLHLRQLAPTVLVSTSRRGDVLAVLRRLGYAPAAESAAGTVEISAPVSRRADDAPGAFGAYVRDPREPCAPWPAQERALAAVRVLRSDGRPAPAGQAPRRGGGRWENRGD
jgi:Helicase conserved C-terminal domain